MSSLPKHQPSARRRKLRPGKKMRGELHRSGLAKQPATRARLPASAVLRILKPAIRTKLPSKLAENTLVATAQKCHTRKSLTTTVLDVVIANVRKKEQTKPKVQRPPEVQRSPAHTINMPPANVIKAPPARPKMEQSTKPTVIQQIINAVGKLLDVPKANQQPARQIQK